MCQRIIVAILFLLAGPAAAQDQAPRQAPAGRSYFGAPVVKYTVIRDQGAMMFGGRGGVHLTPSLLVGGGLYGTMTEVDARAGVPGASGPLDVKFETFGLDLEYAVRPTAPRHLILAAFMGGGAARYAKDKTDEQEGETDFMLLLEPSLGVEQRLTDRLHLNLAASYRLVRGVEQPGLNDGDFRGPAATLALKLGRF